MFGGTSCSLGLSPPGDSNGLLQPAGTSLAQHPNPSATPSSSGCKPCQEDPHLGSTWLTHLEDKAMGPGGTGCRPARDYPPGATDNLPPCQLLQGHNTALATYHPPALWTQGTPLTGMLSKRPGTGAEGAQVAELMWCSLLPGLHLSTQPWTLPRAYSALGHLPSAQLSRCLMRLCPI